MDVYSYGVLLWELVTKELPFRGGLRAMRVPEECASFLLHDILDYFYLYLLFVFRLPVRCALMFPVKLDSYSHAEHGTPSEVSAPSYLILVAGVPLRSKHSFLSV